MPKNHMGKVLVVLMVLFFVWASFMGWLSWWLQR